MHSGPVSIATTRKLWGLTRRIWCDATVELHHASIEPGGYSSQHSHTGKWNLFYVLSGHLQVWEPGPAGEHCRADLRAGDAFLYRTGDRHRFLALESTELIELYGLPPLDPDDIARCDTGGRSDFAPQVRAETPYAPVFPLFEERKRDS